MITNYIVMLDTSTKHPISFVAGTPFNVEGLLEFSAVSLLMLSGKVHRFDNHKTI